MSKPAMPTTADLSAYLYSSGLVSAPPTAQQMQMEIDGALAAAVTEWERGTGWVPFLSGNDSTRTYDPPGPERGPVGIYVGVSNMGGSRKLFLNAGVRSVTAIHVGVTPTSVGSLLALNSDYWLRPQNATAYDRPYTYVEFAVPQWGNPQSITIVAPWGFGAAVPDDAWLAVLKMAVLHLVPSLEIVLTGGQSQIKLGTDSFTFNPQVFQHQAGVWETQVAAVSGRYRRKVMA